MGLLNRVWRTIRANVNSWVEANEDPESLLEQVVMDLQSELLLLRQAVAQAIATQKRTERQQLQHQAIATDWQRRAQLALGQGDEKLARAALTHRQTYLKTAQIFQAQLAQQSEIIQQMRRNLRHLEQKIVEARMKKEMYVARSRSAEAMRRLHELSNSPSAGSSLNAFERMEDRVMQLEAEVQTIAELSQDALEQKFASLDSAQEVEAELTRMKTQPEQNS
jgi:phage shock protein A